MKEAIILAGGFGTRIRREISDLPKSMAPVAGKPFISFIIDYLRMQGIEHFIFAMGFKHEVLLDYLHKSYRTLSFTASIEKDPLGTGGAIFLAVQHSNEKNILVTNGDSLVRANIEELNSFHLKNNAECTVALKHLKHLDRYGAVEIDMNGKIISFREKQEEKEGLINTGLYILNKERFTKLDFKPKFSFEKDYLEANYSEGKFFGWLQDGYFIDIGVPEDYYKAQKDFRKKELDLKNVNLDWTLFLDRDGVINEEKMGEYVLNWDQFIFEKGVPEAFKILSKSFRRIIVISNQRGVGKQLMTEPDLIHIHEEMNREIAETGGNIDRIYYCIDKEETSFNRKPNPGMALQVLKDYPDTDFSKSIMIGNKPGDMAFGRAAGMFTVFLTTTNPNEPFPHPDVDLKFDSLLDFAHALES